MLVDAGSSSNTIGGPVGGSRNVISGNAEGVEITGSATTGTVIAGNLIGTDVTGTFAVGNTAAGVTISGARRHHDRRNDSPGPQHHLGQRRGRHRPGRGAAGTLIQGNYIGVDQTGTQPLGNTGSASPSMARPAPPSVERQRAPAM